MVLALALQMEVPEVHLSGKVGEAAFMLMVNKRKMKILQKQA